MEYIIGDDNIILGINYLKSPDMVLDTNINFSLDRFIGGKVIKASESEVQSRNAILENAQKDSQWKFSRVTYLDAYRKYQAAVNYGEFERVSSVDTFILKLRDKDWTAFDDIPSQIMYFTGEVGFEASGLVRRV